jgi:YfiH family protein
VPLWEIPGWRERFGVTAGITGRGADPAAPFDLGLWTDRPVGQVMARWREFRRTPPQFQRQVTAHQVYGSNVLWHEPAPPGWNILEGADGHATTTAGQLLLITVADCVPVYLVAPRQRAIALVHAGWRGTAAGIVATAVALLKSRASVHSQEIVMHCGVAIYGACYEVGNEVLAAVGQPASANGRSQLDLRALLVEQGKALGIAEISVSGHCTATENSQFFSHRGSGGTDGRMIAYLGMTG